MDAITSLEVARLGLWVTLKMGVPVMTVALVVGLIISLFQALTQIQEMTLTFVPKIVVIFVSLIFMLPMMALELQSFGEGIFDRIIAIGAF
ncbi:MAG: flagellar biosynthesis protein FliQ [Pseudomonadota bacterium]